MYAFVSIADLCFAEHCYVACCYQVVQTILTMELIRARRVTLQICILYKPEKSVILLSANLGLERRWMDSWEDEGLFITQSSTKADISVEMEGNVV